MSLLVSALVMLALQLVVCNADVTCQYYDAATKATFNLVPVQHDAISPWRVIDSRDQQQYNYSYVFNVCNAADPRVYLPPPATQCGNPPPQGAAFQITNSNGACHVLNNNFQSMNWSLVDPTDPTKGVVQTYYGGQACPASPLNGQRALRVFFHCTEAYMNAPTSRVIEPDNAKCTYEVAFDSMYGCPLECPRTGIKLCAGNGVCGYDTDAGVPRCFCDALHTGADCAIAVTPPDTSSSPACDGVCAGLVVLVILLTLLLVASCVIFYRVQKLETMQVKFTAIGSEHNAAAAERGGING